MIFQKIRKKFSTEGEEVQLEDLLAAREKRADFQQKLLAEHRQTLLSVTLTAVGGVKKSPLLDYIFAKALEKLTALFAELKLNPTAEFIRPLATGHEAFFVLPIAAEKLKRHCIELEDSSPLARLWDLDVFDFQGNLLSRTELNQPPRPCLLCEQNAKLCARQRRHSVADILAEMQRRAAADFLAETAKQALLQEVYLTPKPGLVDCADNGSHKDMNVQTFEQSAVALTPFFAKFVRVGMATAALPDLQILAQIRPLGIQAEQAMFQATAGVNTHKGAIFSFGLVCAALGRLWGKLPTESCGDLAAVLHQVAAFTQGLTAELQHYPENAPLTAGVRLFREYGLTGARGEAEAGFPLVKQALSLLCNETQEWQHRLLLALVQLMAVNQDTNVVHRGGLIGLNWLQNQAQNLVNQPTSGQTKSGLIAKLNELNTACIQRNLSAGGSADLLALTIFFYHLLR